MSSRVADVYRDLVARADFDEQAALMISAFHLGADERPLYALADLGLIRARIVPDGRRFRVAERGEGAAQGAWIIPIVETLGGAEEVVIVDLLAFSGAGAIGPWTYEGPGGAASPAMGLFSSNTDGVLALFSQPFAWLRHWLRACACVVDWQHGPEVYGALVLERERIDWTPYRIEAIGPLAGVTEVQCLDDPTLADFISAKMAAPIKRPKLPVVLRRKQREVA